MDVIEIAGANLLRDAADGWQLQVSVVSQDRTRLACILRVGQRLRVERFLRGHMRPQWQGEWWVQQPQHSITDSGQQAQVLADEWLALVG
ncbi:hypothetical protein BW38_03694 [Stenotrophomonas sp. RIT309]|uniref:hypothetical protein n=1 Tax=Stenotrophomonas TaxID=40323 RepID=UPI000445B36D|nr:MULTISPECIES: hypothetical protein [Stenotrophomonas]EZP42831.1 hypothetical protein BW38_03694 [Stenotrophomonas sp. RIT309]WGV55544.1 hypothetical protein QIF44_04285 [Stenotrophomonas indicatrix]